ncbi:MAG: hypothetical protein AB7D29_05530 [Campylobacterales bacterium]
MFGMVLKFQAFMERLKKNKGMWFTTLTTVAILGIIGTLYYLNSMTTRAAKNLYEGTNASYFYDLDSKINDSTQKLEASAALLVANQAFTAALGNAATANAQLKKVGEDLSKISKSPVVAEFYTKNLVKVASSADNAVLNGQPYDYSKGLQKALTSNQPVSGLEYQDGQVFIRVLYPTANGILEIKKSTDFLVDVYSANEKIFQVLLDKDLLDMRKVQEYKNQKIGKSFISVQSKTDAYFLDKLSNIDIDKTITDKYTLTDEYFVLAKPILDPNGKRLGVVVIGEQILKENGLPKMVKSISNGLTTAALGLVVALLMLMV